MFLTNFRPFMLGSILLSSLFSPRGACTATTPTDRLGKFCCTIVLAARMNSLSVMIISLVFGKNTTGSSFVPPRRLSENLDFKILKYVTNMPSYSKYLVEKKL
jgi:hypothetical protein